VLVVVFYNIFCLKLYQNNIFFILKNLFLTSAHQNNKKNNSNKQINFLYKKKKQVKQQLQTSVFESMVAIIFQSIFHLEMHQNNIFFIFKKLFLISAH
jgi:hypothetical protein